MQDSIIKSATERLEAIAKLTDLLLVEALQIGETFIDESKPNEQDNPTMFMHVLRVSHNNINGCISGIKEHVEGFESKPPGISKIGEGPQPPILFQRLEND